MVDVAYGVEPVVALHPEAVVDRQPGTRLQADGLQADVTGAGCAAGGEEDLVGLQAVAGVGDGDDGAVLAGDGLDGDAGAEVHAGLGERLGDQLPGERLHPREQAAVAAHQHRDPGAEGLPGGGHLDGDDSAADDDQAAGRGLGAGGLAAGPGAHLGESGQRGQGGGAAGADGDGVPGGQGAAAAVGAGHLHGARSGEPSLSAVQVDANALDPLDLAVVLPVRGELVAAGEDGLRVEGVLDLLGEAGQAAGVRAGDDRAQQGLAGHARPVGALAADQFALHDRGGEPGRAGAVGDVLSDGARADHHDVVRKGIRLRHGVSLVGGVRRGHMGTCAEYPPGRQCCADGFSPEIRKRDHLMTSTVELTKENFDQTVTENEFVLIDFWAEWCGPCKQFGPVYEKAAEANPDLVFGKVDTEAQPELAQAFGIQSIPTLMIVRDQVAVFAQPGALPEAALTDVIGQARKLDMDEVRKAVAEQQAQAGQNGQEGQ
ncbi:thioredoxin [Streptomyces ambofaciens]